MLTVGFVPLSQYYGACAVCSCALSFTAHEFAASGHSEVPCRREAKPSLPDPVGFGIELYDYRAIRRDPDVQARKTHLGKGQESSRRKGFHFLPEGQSHTFYLRLMIRVPGKSGARGFHLYGGL